MFLGVPKDENGMPIVGQFVVGVANKDEPEIVIVRTVNPSVLSALVKLTGQNFGYHEAGWLQWHNTLHRADPPQSLNCDIRPASGAASSPATPKAAPAPFVLPRGP